MQVCSCGHARPRKRLCKGYIANATSGVDCDAGIRSAAEVDCDAAARAADVDCDAAARAAGIDCDAVIRAAAGAD